MQELDFTNPNYYAFPPAAYSSPSPASFTNAAATSAPPGQPTPGSLYNPYARQTPLLHDGVNYAPPLADARMYQQQPYAGASIASEQSYNYSPLIPTHHQNPFPAPHVSLNVGEQRQDFSNSPTPPTNISMAAPPLPPSPANAQPPTQPAAPTPPAPQSPSTAPSGREAQRMALLLEINEEILVETQRLQAENQGGAISVQHQMSLRQNGQPDKMASEDYIQLLRRLQGNLAYMMPRSGQQQMNPDTKIIAGPAFMQHPPSMPQLADKYAKLRELFPEWPGNDKKLMAAVSSAGGAGSPTAQTSMQQQQQRMQQLQQMQQQQLLQQQQQLQNQNSNGTAPNTNSMQ